MTEVQIQKIEQVRQILAEHFNGAVFVVTAISEDGKRSDHSATWTTVHPTALGLLDLGKDFVKRDIFKQAP